MHMDSSIVVRFAEMGDLDSCLSFDHSHREDIIQNKIEMHEIIVAERCGEVIGYLRLEYIWSELPYIGLITLKPEFRGKHIGSFMLSYLTEFLKANEFVVLLSSSQVNEAGPQAWHRKMGFVECGILNGINKTGIGELFFRLDLGEC